MYAASVDASNNSATEAVLLASTRKRKCIISCICIYIMWQRPIS